MNAANTNVKVAAEQATRSLHKLQDEIFENRHPANGMTSHEVHIFNLVTTEILFVDSIQFMGKSKLEDYLGQYYNAQFNCESGTEVDIYEIVCEVLRAAIALEKTR